jgi:FAD/FMN-containing dehydrogenase
MTAPANAAHDAPPGQRITPSDSRYSTMVRGFNPRWVGSPKYVALCADTAQVVEAVQRALDEGLRVTVRSGGHCYENFACGNDGGAIVDLSLMHGVYEDAEYVYCVEGGATLWNVYSELYRCNTVTLPGGSCYSVGAGGHVTGGGYGLLSRKHGLIIDHLYEVEVVCVDADGRARAVRVNRDSTDPDERELLWAHLGGGGGNFGIVTRFWFRDPPLAPSEAHLVSMAWNWSELSRSGFGDLIQSFGRFFAANSAVGSPYDGLFALLHLSQNARADSQIVLTAQYVGDEPALLAEFTRTISDSMPKPTAQRAPAGHQRPPATSARRPPASNRRRCRGCGRRCSLTAARPTSGASTSPRTCSRRFQSSRSTSCGAISASRSTPTPARCCRSTPTAARSTRSLPTRPPSRSDRRS